MSKVAFISTMSGSPWGGSEELWSRTAQRLIHQGVAVGANVQWWPTPSSELQALEKVGCQVYSRRPKHRFRAVLGSRYREGFYQWLRKFQPTLAVISIDYHGHGLEWMQECIKRSIPYVTVVQSAGIDGWPTDDEVKSLAQAYEAARVPYFVSHGNLELVRSQLATPLRDARIVRNPFKVAYTKVLPWPESNRAFRLACVGRLHPASKGQDIILDVLRTDKWRQRPIEVSLFGSGENKHALIAQKECYGLNNVTLAGFSLNVEEIWRTHHALLLPSRYEGLSLAVVEAMLCGRPCIVTDVAGNAELIEDNATGFVAAAPTVRLVDDALERAWQRRDEWQQIGQEAARRVREQVPEDPATVFAEELSGWLERLRREK